MASSENRSRKLVRSDKVDLHPDEPKAPEVDDDSDYTSSSGSSSEEVDDNDDDDLESTAQDHQDSSKPHSIPSRTRANDGLKSRLAAFLPQIERSNRELQNSDDIEAHRIEHVDENTESYIEMNLNLGVLSEQQSDGNEKVRVKDDSSDECEDQKELMPVTVPHGQQASQKDQAAKGNNKIEEL